MMEKILLSYNINFSAISSLLYNIFSIFQFLIPNDYSMNTRWISLQMIFKFNLTKFIVLNIKRKNFSNKTFRIISEYQNFDKKFSFRIREDYKIYTVCEERLGIDILTVQTCCQDLDQNTAFCVAE